MPATGSLRSWGCDEKVWCVTLSPLLDAVPPISFHAAMAMLAFGLGVAQFLLPKGTRSHRALGWLWVTLMLGVSVSSFWIHGHNWRLWKTWSPIHLLSIFTIVMLAVGVYHARRHRVLAHGRTMSFLFIGALVIAGAFTLVPGRIMHTVVFGP